MNRVRVSVPIRRFERLTSQMPPALPGDCYSPWEQRQTPLPWLLGRSFMGLPKPLQEEFVPSSTRAPRAVLVLVPKCP